MRLVLPLVAVLLVAAAGILAAGLANRIAVRRDRQALAAAVWRTAHRSDGGVTRVLVRHEVPDTGQVLDEREVSAIPDDDADYDAKFLEAMATAQARAALFNGQGGAAGR